MMRYGYNNVVTTDDEDSAVGAEFRVGDRIVNAPIGVARTLAKLSKGPARLTEFELQGVAVLDVPVSTGATGHSKSHVPITLRSWFAVPKPPQAAAAPAPTTTLFYRHQR